MMRASWHIMMLRIGDWLRKRWWETGLARPRVCRILAIDRAGQVLMVRHNYGSPHWSLPGGGIRMQETAVDAGQRELREETGCVLEEARVLVCFNERVRRTTVKVSLVGGLLNGMPRADNHEIGAVALYAANALPGDCFSGMAGAIERWQPTLRAALAETRAYQEKMKPRTGSNCP